VSRDIDQAGAVEAAMGDATVARFAAGPPKKIIFVPGRLLNIVV
jgi:leucyl-tRNA synthetase